MLLMSMSFTHNITDGYHDSLMIIYSTEVTGKH